MPLLGIIFIILSSLLTGTLITSIFRERNSAFVVKFATGFLSLFVFLLITILVSLKLDWNLSKMSKTYLVLVILASLVSIPAVIKAEFKNINLSFSKPFWYLIIAGIVGIISFALFSQSYINDDTLEIAYTSVSTDTIYEYSSLTGNKMINGLPIFNKIYVVPMLVSFFYKVFKLNPVVLTMFVLPIIVYTTNIMLVSLIADKITVSSKNIFMSSYIVLLVCGTYLPVFGIPVTAGYALLRQGYSGYAVIYGIIIPLIVLSLLDKKYSLLIIYLPAILPLLRFDRIIFTILDIGNSYHAANTAGKQFGLILITLLTVWVLSTIKSENMPIGLFVAPMLLTSYVVTLFVSKTEKIKEKTIMCVSFLLIALVCVNFKPYDGAITTRKFWAKQEQVTECVKELANSYESPVIFADSEFMAYARLNDCMARTLYGRDFNSLYMVGLNYEDTSSDIYDFYRFMENKNYGFNYLVTDKSDDEILLAAKAEGASLIVISNTVNAEKEIDLYSNAGFKYKGIIASYSIYSLE